MMQYAQNQLGTLEFPRIKDPAELIGGASENTGAVSAENEDATG